MMRTIMSPLFDLVGHVVSGREARRLPPGSLVWWVRDSNPATAGRFKLHDGQWSPMLGGNNESYRVIYVAPVPAPARVST